MSTRLDAQGRVLFEQLTARPLLVVDTEFAIAGREHHIISVAVVPVVAGRAVRASAQLHRVMDPGVPIDARTGAVHGFTDADVSGLDRFAAHAAALRDALVDPGAVLVSHGTIDAHVLRREFERLDAELAPGAVPWLGQLADLPVLDTQRLAYAVGYPGAGRSVRVSLDRLCDLAGVPRPSPAHDALADARATAAALLELLRHAAQSGALTSLGGLLAAAGGGTLLAPAGPSRLRARDDRPADVPAEHLARHGVPLTEPVTARSVAAARWLDMAAECAALRCPYLRDEALVAGPANGAVLLRPLAAELPHLGEPGQPGTLLGAVLALLDGAPVTSPSPALPALRALRWWRPFAPLLAASVPCDRASGRCCPACAQGLPCPRDVVALPVFEAAAVGGSGRMTPARARELYTPTRTSPITTWRRHHPEALGYGLWRAAVFLREAGALERAGHAVDAGIAAGVHLRDARLALLAAERLLELGDPQAAFDVADRVLAGSTTDPAFAELADWQLATRAQLAAVPAPPVRVIVEPRRARPDGMAHPRLYS